MKSVVLAIVLLVCVDAVFNHAAITARTLSGLGGALSGLHRNYRSSVWGS